MVVIIAIGRFFKKIWDWIKQTAWIQPLLIVGVIFGIIFSIPSIVKAVNASRKEKSTYAAYYHNFKLSLEGEAESEADKFTDDLYEVIRDGKVDNFRTNHADLGDKFFVAYVEKNCDPCEQAKEGFSRFQEQFDKYIENDGSFHLVTIFTDEETTDSDETNTAFMKYMDRHTDFFSEVGSVVYETDYYKNGHILDTTLEAFETADPKGFKAPAIMLVELNPSDEEKTRGYDIGVTELMFGVEGSDKNAKAVTLSDCWKHTGEFSNNPEK